MPVIRDAMALIVTSLQRVHAIASQISQISNSICLPGRPERNHKLKKKIIDRKCLWNISSYVIHCTSNNGYITNHFRCFINSHHRHVWYVEFYPFICSSSFERLRCCGIKPGTTHCDFWKKPDWIRFQTLQEIPGYSTSRGRSNHGLRQRSERTLRLHLHPTSWLLVLLWGESVWKKRRRRERKRYVKFKSRGNPHVFSLNPFLLSFP